jgi:hypothetical protein
MMLDPLSAAVCSPEEIREMAGKLFTAEAKFIPAWCNKVVAMKVAKLGKAPKATGDGAAAVSAMAARNVSKKKK